MIVTLGTLEPMFVGLIEKNRKLWMIIPLSTDQVAGVHESMLADAMLICSSSENALRYKLAAMFPEFKEDKWTLRR